eukprot:CAMPEP_0113535912 /NCGR_PEP_ID=MMETSP0015_2-20120614/5969_1 /TAXON_ID=2838 /ORGANISM="Odontella" /LENGTH=527 /DNA_ID=CAMNT_0000435219 /DNA_START=323 /DNA_END=1906 /DNA_ORIENTATION=+ /assembly_acc=CAM_ASM_000160
MGDSDLSNRRDITLALLRKRSEHNENLVSTLEELALHQEELEAIGPVLGRTCGKTLKILLLQNNVISRMDPAELRFFKRLEYLNLALNNIKRVEGLERCECLRKLDLTLNFIDVEDLERSVDELLEVQNLKELYLMGNPCCYDETHVEAGKISQQEQVGGAIKGWAGCRPYVIARLPQLESLDGKEVARSERIAARQRLSKLTSELCGLVQERRKGEVFAKEKSCRKLELETATIAECATDVSYDREDENPIDDNELTTHSPSVRARISREMATQREAKDSKERANLPRYRGEKEFDNEQKEAVQRAREREAKLEENGEIRQCNEGKLTFAFDESTVPGSILLFVDVQRYLSTSLIDVDVHPTYISIVIKSKILRLTLPAEVKAEKAEAERSTVTGKLVVTMPKVDPEENMLAVRAAERARERQNDATRVTVDEGVLRAGRKGNKTISSRKVGRIGLASDMLHDASTAAGTRLKGAVRIDDLVRGKCNEEDRSRNESFDMKALSSRRKDLQGHDVYDSDDDVPPPLL